MIEIRVTKEIKNYREKFFFGLTVRQCVCAAAALLICVPLYIFGGKFLPEELISWLVMIIAAPLMLVGFFRYNDMTFEKFAVEWFYHTFAPQKRIYSFEPVFMALRKTYLAEELAAEISRKEKNNFIKKLLKRRKKD